MEQHVKEVAATEKRASASIPKYTAPIYLKKVSIPKSNIGPVTIFSHLGLDNASKIMRALFPKWTRSDHLDAAKEYQKELNKINAKYTKVRNQAAKETFGRDWQFTDYQVSGIGSDKFSESKKNQLRKLDAASHMLSNLVYAHEKAAKSRNFSKDA